jgi:hypothetical protein
LPRDAELIKIETQVRTAIRDSVNRASRKPFYWGGLKGYQQLELIAEVLHQAEGMSVQNEFFQSLILQLDRTLAQNKTLAAELEQAHRWLRKVATCLRYPPTSYSETEWHMINSQQVAYDMEHLLEQLRQEAENKSILSRFHHALSKRWKAYGSELLHCYDIPGLPPHNLQLEGFFNRLRCHQRRVSGRRSTKELRDFGQFQALFMANSQTDLLEQIRSIPVEEYKKCRQRLIDSESPRRFINQFHRDPKKTIYRLLDRYVEHQRELELSSQLPNPPPSICNV